MARLQATTITCQRYSNLLILIARLVGLRCIIVAVLQLMIDLFRKVEVIRQCPDGHAFQTNPTPMTEQCWPIEIHAPVGSPQEFGYRHKARLSTRYVSKLDRVMVGYRMIQFPRHVAETTHCHVV
jgi:hypothetical protein